MLTDFKNRSINAAVWSGIDAFSQQGLRFITTMILARLLTPADYGVIGMLAIFIGLSTAFIESGLSNALIQRQAINEVDISSVFYFNIAMGLLFCVLLWLSAPWIASFFNMPLLKPLTWVAAANLFIGSFGSIQNALLIKALNFKKISLIFISSSLISSVVAIILAWHQFGVWSLAVQTIVGTIVATSLLWSLNTWRPRLIFSRQSIRSLFKFSSFILLFVLVDVLYTRLNTIVIGKWYSARDLGQYTRADQTQQLPGGLIARIIGRVAFPIFSAAHKDKAILKAGLKKAITAVMMINLPLMFGLVATAKPLVLVLFGNQWAPCVPYMQILSLGGVLIPLQVLNMNVLAAQGHSNLLFYINLINKTVGMLLVGIACFFSITMIAWSTAVTAGICFFINTHYTGVILGYGAFRQIGDIIPYLAGAVVMAACAWAVTLLQIDAPVILVVLQVFIGFIVYCLFCYLLRLSAFVEGLQLIRNYLTPYFTKKVNEQSM